MIKISEELAEVLERGIADKKGDKLKFLYANVTEEGNIYDPTKSCLVETDKSKEEILEILVHGYAVEEDNTLKTYAASFPGEYISGYAIVMETSRINAHKALNEQLASQGFGQVDLEEVWQLQTDKPGVHVLFDGNY